MPKLVIRSETGELISHDLVEETYTIGRAPENSIRLEDNSVSGRHAELAVVAENCYLKDLGSTNGTVVNGKAITEVQLRADKSVTYGRVAELIGVVQEGGLSRVGFVTESAPEPAR